MESMLNCRVPEGMSVRERKAWRLGILDFVLAAYDAEEFAQVLPDNLWRNMTLEQTTLRQYFETQVQEREPVRDFREEARRILAEEAVSGTGCTCGECR